MKKIGTFFLAFCFWGLLSAQTYWTEQDRHYLIKYLEDSKTALLLELEGLTDEQATFRPDSTSWSINEVLEHLGAYEEHLFWDLYYQQFFPERPDLRNMVRANDEDLMDYANDPNKGKASWMVEPIGRFETTQELSRYFLCFRNNVIAYLKRTKSDLRTHFIYRDEDRDLWAFRDLHQHTLLWGAHTLRHTKQIQRIKDHPDFPKSQPRLWTVQERNELIQAMERSKNELLDEIRDMGPVEWHFRDKQTGWSIAEIVEHLIRQDEMLYRELFVVTRTPQDQKYLKYIRSNEEVIREYVDDPEKVEAEWALQPMGYFVEQEVARSAFLNTRNKLIDYLRSTDLDLRRFFTFRNFLPDGGMSEDGNWDVRDLHQLFLTTIAHNNRHLNQLRELKKLPGYPRP